MIIEFFQRYRYGGLLARIWKRIRRGHGFPATYAEPKTSAIYDSARSDIKLECAMECEVLNGKLRGLFPMVKNQPAVRERLVEVVAAFDKLRHTIEVGK